MAIPAQLLTDAGAHEQLAAAGGFQTWQRFRRHRLALVGAAMLTAITLASIFAPLIAPYYPYMPDPFNMTAVPSLQHWLGTDQNGSDVLSRLIYGGRYSLGIGVSAALLSTVIGLVIGAMAGWMGGWVDNAHAGGTAQAGEGVPRMRQGHPSAPSSFCGTAGGFSRVCTPCSSGHPYGD